MATLQPDNVVALRLVAAPSADSAPLLAATTAMTQALERFAAAAQAIGAADVDDIDRARLLSRLGQVTSAAATLQLSIVSLHFGL